MKRTQLYIDETLFHRLSLLSREKKTTISDLVRKALEQVYGKKQSPEARLKALQAIRGIWKSRKNLESTQTYVRSLRRDSRSKRLGLK
jgi:Arc/MetJ-type ribon-helix-helix transcriptional regulator